jgi:galacturan 1,4-alpha-galacturonidase
MKFLCHILQLLATSSLAFAAYSPSSPEHTCVIPALNDGRDDAPAIREAFSKCGNNGKVIFQKDTTYSIQTALQLHDLKNVQVDILGTLEVIHNVNQSQTAQ